MHNFRIQMAATIFVVLRHLCRIRIGKYVRSDIRLDHRAHIYRALYNHTLATFEQTEILQRTSQVSSRVDCNRRCRVSVASVFCPGSSPRDQVN